MSIFIEQKVKVMDAAMKVMETRIAALEKKVALLDDERPTYEFTAGKPEKTKKADKKWKSETSPL